MTEVLPMDRIEEDAPLPTPEPVEDRAPEQPRHDDGKFAPKQEGPRGQPDPNARARREAQERDEARRERDEARTQAETLQRRWDELLAKANGSDEKPDADPIAEIKETLGTITQRFQQQDEQAQTAEVWQQVRSFADQDEARFVQQQPDFPQAAQHYINSRIGELGALGYDQASIERQLQTEAEALLLNCAQRSISPAEGLYNMAKARGYQAGAQVVQQPARQQNVGGRSMGTGGGSAGGGVAASQIAAMSDEDYMAFRNTPEGRRAIRLAQGGA